MVIRLEEAGGSDAAEASTKADPVREPDETVVETVPLLSLVAASGAIEAGPEEGDCCNENCTATPETGSSFASTTENVTVDDVGRSEPWK